MTVFVYPHRTPSCSDFYFEPSMTNDYLGQPKISNWSLEDAYKASLPDFRKVLKNVKLGNKHKYITVKAYFKTLPAKTYPCMPDWHTDCTMDPWHNSKPDVNHLFTFGANCFTKFLDCEAAIDLVNSDALVADYKKAIHNWIQTNNPTVFTIKPGYIWTYDRFAIHAPNIGTGNRFFLRVTESDIVRPISPK